MTGAYLLLRCATVLLDLRTARLCLESAFTGRRGWARRPPTMWSMKRGRNEIGCALNGQVAIHPLAASVRHLQYKLACGSAPIRKPYTDPFGLRIVKVEPIQRHTKRDLSIDLVHILSAWPAGTTEFLGGDGCNRLDKLCTVHGRSAGAPKEERGVQAPGCYSPPP
jgi:hypothetical protein